MALRKIVVATDFSDPSRAALRRAKLLAADSGAEVVVLHAFDNGRRGAPAGDRARAEIEAEERNAVQLLLDTALRELTSAGLKARELRVDGSPVEAIPEAARVEAADLLVLGSHGRTGVQRILLGSVAEKMVRVSEVPVLVARGPADAPFKKPLVATDLAEGAERALVAALDLAAPGSTVDVVHFLSVVPLFAMPVGAIYAPEVERLELEARRAGAALVERHRRDGLELRFATEIGDPRDGALRRIDERGHDLVAVGSHGRTGLTRAFVGSVSEAIVRHAACSVLVCR